MPVKESLVVHVSGESDVTTPDTEAALVEDQLSVTYSPALMVMSLPPLAVRVAVTSDAVGVAVGGGVEVAPPVPFTVTLAFDVSPLIAEGSQEFV